MSLLLGFDSETTDIPDWKVPSDAPHQPHIVQLAAVLVDSDTRETVEQMNVIVRPDGWEITQETIDVHGITMEKALEVGIPERHALEQFMDLWSRCDLRIAHNTTFDNRIIRIALKRYMPDLVSDAVWKDKKRYYCTLINSRKVMGGKDGHKLGQCYKHFTGKDLEGAHDALVDVNACMEIYFALTGDIQKKGAVA